MTKIQTTRKNKIKDKKEPKGSFFVGFDIKQSDRIFPQLKRYML